MNRCFHLCFHLCAARSWMRRSSSRRSVSAWRWGGRSPCPGMPEIQTKLLLKWEPLSFTALPHLQHGEISHMCSICSNKCACVHSSLYVSSQPSRPGYPSPRSSDGYFPSPQHAGQHNHYQVTSHTHTHTPIWWGAINFYILYI